MLRRSGSWCMVVHGQVIRGFARRTLRAGALAGVLGAVSIASHARADQLPLRSVVVDVARRTPAESAAALRDIGRTGVRHALVQFDRPITDDIRSRMSAAGVDVQGFLGAQAFLVALHADGLQTAALSRIDSLVGVQAIQPHWKIHPLLAGLAAPGVAGEAPPSYAIVGKEPQGGDIIAAYVLFHQDIDITTIAPLLARHSAVLRDTLETVNGAVIELPAAAVASLAAEDNVMWIEPPLPPMSEVNAENRALTQANTVQASPYNLDGTGVNVLVYDAGTGRATHQDFGGRLTVRDASGTVSHSTHVAGTIGGSGAASGGNNRGMAPAVTMQAYGYQPSGGGTILYTNPGDIEADYGQAINTFGVDIASNSIGSNVQSNGFPCSIQGDYGVTDALIDGIVRGSLGGGPFRIIWAGGNERQGSSCDVEGFGDYYSIAPPSGAKNHISVGAVNANDDSMTSFSSWGPTDDGRMKPDISAPGCQVGGDGGVTSCTSTSDTSYGAMCGTSMACPTVAGCCALLLQDFRVQFSGQPDPRNSTLKILLAQQAVDRGNVGPDYQFGYGSIRIKDTIDFMRTGNFDEGDVAQGGVVEYHVNVPAGTPVLKATLAWDDPAGTPLAANALINDLDIVAIDPIGNVRMPWTLNPLNPSAAAVQTAANHRDNLEQVLVNAPAAGTWTIRVTGFNVPQGPQPFSVCVTPNLNPAPGVYIQLGALPTTLTPDVPAAVPVQVLAFEDTLVPGSAELLVRYEGSEFISIPLTPQGGTSYLATLPPATCNATPEYYFRAEGDVTGPVTNPPGAPAVLYSAVVGQTVTIANEAFEGGANGWVGGAPGDTATTGIWVQVDPIGTAAQPEDDHTPSPGIKCWVTGQGTVGGAVGAADVDGGLTTLVSPVFDLSGSAAPKIGYWRWYSNNAGGAPNADVFRVQVSNNNGASWVLAETVGPAGAGTSGGWIFHEIDVASFVPPTSQVRIRFIAEDAATGSVIEAAVDDLAITSFQCNAVLADCNENGIVDSDDIASGRSDDSNANQIPDECERADCVADIVIDGAVNVNDLLSVIATWGSCPAPCPPSCTPDIAPIGPPQGDCQVDVNDLLMVITTWGPCP